MAITYLAGSIITGLSSDTKPTTASNGSIFIETDTGSRFVINSGTWTSIVGGNLDGLTDVDLTTATPTNNQVLTYTTTGTKWVPATPPGSGGGEANTTSNVGTGEGTLALAKSGVNLPFKSLKQGTNITLTNNANDVTISSTGGGGSVTPSSTDTFTNKTIDADGTGNVITNIENADIKASAGIVTSKLADSANFILKTLDNSFGAHYQDVTKMTAPGNPGANDIRLYVDTADTHMKIKNSAGTVVDLHSGGGGGGSGTGSIKSGNVLRSGDATTPTTQFTIAHGFGSTPASAIVIPSSSDAMGSYTTDVDGTNITLTYSTPPPTGTNNLEYFWLVSSADITNGGIINAGISASSTDTLINKTINPTSNIMSFINGFAFSIYQDSGAVKLRNNLTGVVTSYATLGPAVDAVLANTGNPTAEIQTGTYNLASGFTGWNVVSKTHIKCQGLVIINVPDDFNGNVWNFIPNNTVLYLATIDGGYYDEQGSTPSYAWNCINMGPTGTTGAVHDCRVKNIQVWRANTAIWIHTTGTTWANENYFTEIQATACKYFIYFDHTGTFTLNQSGPCSNHFINCAFQATVLDNTNHYPQALGGIVNIVGQWNQFTKCMIWDLLAANSAAPPMTISSNAYSTCVIGGLCTSGANFLDNGTDTTIIDETKGIYTKNRLIINRNALSSLDESLLNFSVSDASGDSFELANSSSTNGIFAPFFRSTQTSAAASAALVGLYFETIVKAANDTAGGVACNVISAKRDSNVNLTARAIFGIYNKWDPIYVFYPDYADFGGKQLRNTIYNEVWTSKSATYNLADTDYGIILTGTGTYTVNLPAVLNRAGKVYKFIKTGASGTVTIDGAASETINGATTRTMTTQWAQLEIVCDGSAWFVVNSGTN